MTPLRENDSFTGKWVLNKPIAVRWFAQIYLLHVRFFMRVWILLESDEFNLWLFPTRTRESAVVLLTYLSRLFVSILPGKESFTNLSSIVSISFYKVCTVSILMCSEADARNRILTILFIDQSVEVAFTCFYSDFNNKFHISDLFTTWNITCSHKASYRRFYFRLIRALPRCYNLSTFFINII